ncbi:MAG: hypothetical protein FJY07_09465 [Bacteroidetes bacterium]|nr:hypothetical protein [Bacteroidota bacterium]
MLSFSIRKELFWDIDFNKLDQTLNKRLIIERVLSYGNLSELKTIYQFYGKDVITEEIKKAGYLDPKTIAFVTGYFGIKREELKCCIKKQSDSPFWNCFNP